MSWTSSARGRDGHSRGGQESVSCLTGRLLSLCLTGWDRARPQEGPRPSAAERQAGVGAERPRSSSRACDLTSSHGPHLPKASPPSSTQAGTTLSTVEIGRPSSKPQPWPGEDCAQGEHPELPAPVTPRVLGSLQSSSPRKDLMPPSAAPLPLTGRLQVSQCCQTQPVQGNRQKEDALQQASCSAGAEQEGETLGCSFLRLA